VAELHGADVLQAATVLDRASGERRRLPVGAVFAFIGAQPRTDWLAGYVELDGSGFVRTGPDADDPARAHLAASRGGVFAVGDVRSGSTKRVASAVGEGSMAVTLVHQHLAQTFAR